MSKRKEFTKRQLRDLKKVRDEIIASRCNAVPGDVVFARWAFKSCIRPKGHGGAHASYDLMLGLNV